MSAQSGNRADSQQDSHKGSSATIFDTARVYARNHRNVLAIVTVSAITAAIVTPYIATAGVKSFGNVITGQPLTHDSQPVREASDMDRQEQETVQHSTGSNASNSQTSVTVNGQHVPVPDNGSYHKTIDNGSSHTEINVESSQSSTGNGSSNSNNSSVQLNVRSESHSSSHSSD